MAGNCPEGSSERIMQETRPEYASKTNDYLLLQKSIQYILEGDRIYCWWVVGGGFACCAKIYLTVNGPNRG